nr:protocadherin Fat 2-like [Solea senegalensis]XP_043872334.1 protocadherin Fat 2-like [Solea senegalensis]
MIGYVEIMEISASVLGLLLLVSIFVCVRKRYVQNKKKKKPVCVQDSNGYFHSSLAKNHKHENPEGHHIEMSSLVCPSNDLDHTPFRSLRPRSQVGLSGGGVSPPKTQGPVVCSVAPNLPARPPSSSDNDSIRKNHWDMDYEVYPADPDYYGRPSVQEFPQFDIVEDTYSNSTVDSRRNSRFGGFPFPLDRCDRRAPLPPCYSNQNLDQFLGPDGHPLPRSQCPNEYTAISYYPTQKTRSLDSVSGGYKRLSMRLSVAMPSYAEQPDPQQPPPPNAAQPQTRPTGQNPRNYDGSSMVGSDYGSCEEVMF